MKEFSCVLMVVMLVAMLWTRGWGNEERAEFAGAPNLILNPGFESDTGGGIVGKEEEARFSARGDGIPDEWQCENAVMDTEIAHSGESSVRLAAPGGSVVSTSALGRFPPYIGFVEESTVATRPAGVPVLLSAWSRAEEVPEGSTYHLECRIGAKTYTLVFSPGTHDWEKKSLVVVPEEDFTLPQVRISFQAPEGSGARVWFDDVYLGQLQPYPNLVVNAGFERGTGEGLPEGWEKLPADYMPYWGGYYWPASRDTLMSHTGTASLRCAAAAGQTGGAAQTIHLRQKEASAIIVGAYCRAENLIADDLCWLAVDTWYDNGKRDLETHRVVLGKAGHEWDYRTFTILPKRPVDRIVVKIENRSSLRTATVWVDDLYVAEVGTTLAELRARGLTLPDEVDCNPLAEGKKPTIDGRVEEECWLETPAVQVGPNSVTLAYDEENLYLAVSAEAERMEIMLSPFGIPGYDDIDHISFYRFAVSRDGSSSAEIAIDQDGYVFYLPDDLSPHGWEAAVASGPEKPDSQPETRNSKPGYWTAEMSIPFAALGMNPPSSGEEWRINIAAVNPARPLTGDAAARLTSWAAEHEDFRSFGRLCFVRPEQLELSQVSFGEELPDGLDVSDTWVTRSDVRWGDNILRARLTNSSASLRALTVEVKPIGAGEGSSVTASVGAGDYWDIGLPYRTTRIGRQALRLNVKEADSGETVAGSLYPINVAEPIQLRPDQLYYYPDETEALLKIACPSLPADGDTSLHLRLIGQSTGETFLDTEFPAESRMVFGMDISGLPVSSEPVREYRCQVDLVQGGTTLASGYATFGRLERPEFPWLPAVETVEIGAEGAMLVNGEPFFPIIASLRNNGPYDRASAMGFNAEKTNLGSLESGKARIDDAWERNVYFVVCDVQSNTNDRDALTLFARDHPGVLMHVGSEVAFSYGGWYFTEEGRELFRRRQRLDPKHPMFFEYEGGCGTWYARALGVPLLGDVIHMGAMVQISPLGRVVPRAFDLERAAAQKPQEVQAVVMLWDEGSFDEVRTGIYLAVIHGARGIYYYEPRPDNEIDKARGLVLELRAIAPIVLSPSVPRTVSVLPARNHIDVLQREYEGKTYLITCNRSEEPEEVEFRLPNLTPDTPIIRRFEPERPVERTADGKGFKDAYGPYEVHVYEIG